MIPWQTEVVQALLPKGVPPKSNASGSSIEGKLKGLFVAILTIKQLNYISIVP